MKQEKILQIIYNPLVTEKSSSVLSQKQIVLKVRKDANKRDIKIAAEHLLEAKVMAVNIINVKGKAKYFGRKKGHRKDFKKAYVSLDKSVDMETLLSEQQGQRG